MFSRNDGHFKWQEFAILFRTNCKKMNDVNPIFFYFTHSFPDIILIQQFLYGAVSSILWLCVTCWLQQFIRRQIWLIGNVFLNCCIAKIFGCFEDYLLPIVVIFLCPLLVEGLVEHSSSSWLVFIPSLLSATTLSLSLRKRFFLTFPIFLSLVLFHSYCKSWGNSTKCSFKQSHQETRLVVMFIKLRPCW